MRHTQPEAEATGPVYLILSLTLLLETQGWNGLTAPGC